MVNEEYFKDSTLYATRPETVQRDDLCYVISEKGGKDVKAITIPLEGRNRGIYLGKKFAEKYDAWLVENINAQEKFEDHVRDFDELNKRYDSAIEVFKKTKKNKKKF